MDQGTELGSATLAFETGEAVRVIRLGVNVECRYPGFNHPMLVMAYLGSICVGNFLPPLLYRMSHNVNLVKCVLTSKGQKGLQQTFYVLVIHCLHAYYT